MGVILPAPADNATVTVPNGDVQGALLLNRTGCTWRGGGRDVSRIIADGTYQQMVLATGLVGGGTVAAATFEDLELDGNQLNLAAIVDCSVGGPQSLTMRRVRIRNASRNTIAIFCGGYLDLEDVEIMCDGVSITVNPTTTGFRARDLLIRGGRGGVIATDGDGPSGVVPGIDIDGLDIAYYYWATPTYEAVTVTGYGALYATVTSHVVAHRGLYDVLRVLTPRGTYAVGGSPPVGTAQWDRIEMVDGRWTQVLAVSPAGTLTLDAWRAAGSWNPIAAPSGTATVYDVVIGRYFGCTATQLDIQTGGGIPKDAGWQRLNSHQVVATPTVVAGSRLDIIRHGYTAEAAAVRDVDVGAIHLTHTALNPSVRNAVIVGGFSDQFTSRSPGTSVYNVRCHRGQDNNFSVDGENGRQVLRMCQSTLAGNHGFAVFGGPSDLHNCIAEENGRHGTWWGGGGFTVAPEASDSILQNCRGSRNVRADVAGPSQKYAAHQGQLQQLSRARGLP